MCKRIREELTAEELCVIFAEAENHVARAFEVGEEALVAYDIRSVTVESLKDATRFDFEHFAE
jgi:hypothetical protein